MVQRLGLRRNRPQKRELPAGIWYTPEQCEAIEKRFYYQAVCANVMAILFVLCCTIAAIIA